MRVLQVRLGPNDPTLQSSKPQGFSRFIALTIGHVDQRLANKMLK